MRHAGCLALVLLLILCNSPQVHSAENPCSNGSFEILGPNGFPADWAPLGRAEVIPNAADGQRALRLVRAGEPPLHETGLNRLVLNRELKGGIRFAYQGVAASNAFLRIYVIPVNAEGIEKHNALRTVFQRAGRPGG